MFVEAGHAISDQVMQDQLNQGLLYPPQSNILETEIQTAIHIAKVIFDHNLARVERPDNLETWICSQVYKPKYKSMI